MNRKKNYSEEENLTPSVEEKEQDILAPDTEAEEKEETPGGIEVPRDDVCEKEVPEHTVAKEDPSVFTERVLLGVELIKSKSLEEILTILDYQLDAIRNLAIKKITEYKD